MSSVRESARERAAGTRNTGAKSERAEMWARLPVVQHSCGKCAAAREGYPDSPRRVVVVGTQRRRQPGCGYAAASYRCHVAWQELAECCAALADQPAFLIVRPAPSSSLSAGGQTKK
jgi:hypothetical protein